MLSACTYIIIDDEPKAVKMLQSKITQLYPNLKKIAEYNFWIPALEGLKSQDFDILFIDISMPQKNGFSLLELVPNLKCEIIFVTAYEEHALNSFNYSPSGYILKPINDAINN